MKRVFSVLTAALLACSMLASCGETDVEDEVYIPIRTGNKVNYETTTAMKGTLMEQVTLNGSITTPYSMDLSFTHIGGKIAQINVRQDMDVKAGDVIAVLDDEALEEEIVIQKLKLDSAKSTYDTLVNKHASKNDIEFAKIDYDIEQLKYDTLVEKRDFLTLRAPFDGKITSMRNYRVGSHIDQNAHLCTISDSSKVCLTVADYNGELKNVAFGTRVDIDQGALASTEGRVVDTITTSGFSGGGMGGFGGGFGGGNWEVVDVTNYIIQCDEDISFSELGGITVTFTTLRRDGAIIVPQDAIFEATDVVGNTSQFVNVLMNGIKVQTPVTVGLICDGRAEILNGLEGYETLIMR